METRAKFRETFEKPLGWFNSVKLEEGVYFQAPDDITKPDSLYLKFQNVLKEIIEKEPELAEQVKNGEKDLGVLENHEKAREFLGLGPPVTSLVTLPSEQEELEDS
ncbi:24827_t:CDS:2 [Entrophospora sp. SA101]|nr:11790_t:CDS:2 [Entrophospora sp. SA101]CAJ0751925.1 19687_t:CDS:2 [Entrophospora sp. SA101]CAJ0758326.1 24827_t:CDS:2 [Entrophospora sp. SA101]CAJ0825601.1 6485_t:CDS:2 [Entrophospora sp. SA101]CAJ0839090.1 12831_t:CDS:2 [Entrophospora sp. SA101]